MGDTLQTLAVGAGGLTTYWLARRQFVSERVWEKRYELYSELFALLNSIEHSVRVLEGALHGGPSERQSDASVAAAKAYEAGVLSLNQVQERLMLLGAKDAHLKVMVLYAALHSFDPLH